MSSDDDQEFIRYGKPLPEFHKDPLQKDKNNKQLIAKKTTDRRLTQYRHDLRAENQEVRDAQGRRRFHGAFTGGWSAGHYNTVGSEKGWTPNNKFDRDKQFTKEDYMDEDDFSEFGIRPKNLLVKQNKRDSNLQGDEESYKRRGHDNNTNTNGSSHSILPKISSTIGVRILRSMGFVQNSSTASNSLAHIEKSVVLKRKLLLAKNNNDVKMTLDLLEQRMNLNQQANANLQNLVQKLKNNCETDYSNYQIPTSNNQTFGMGYKKLSGLLNHGIGEKKSESISENNVFGKKSLKFGGGFGVGAFEEEDDDIYAKDCISNYDIDMTIEQGKKRKFKDQKKEKDDPDNDYSLLALGYHEGVLFKPARKNQRFTRFMDLLSRPEIPHTWKPKIPVIRKNTENSNSTKLHNHFSSDSNINSRKRILQDEQDRIDARREKDRLRNEKMAEERRDALQKELEEKLKQEQEDRKQKKEALLKSIFSNKFVHATGKTNDKEDQEKTKFGMKTAVDFQNDQNKSQASSEFQETNSDIQKITKKLPKMSLSVQDWAPHNTLCKRYNVPNPGVIDDTKIMEEANANFKKSMDQKILNAGTNSKSHFGDVLPAPGEMVDIFGQNQNEDLEEETKEEKKLNIQEDQNNDPTANLATLTAIFGDESDSDSDNENQDDEVTDQNFKTLSKETKTEARKLAIMPSHIRGHHKDSNAYHQGMEMKYQVDNIFEKFLKQVRTKEVELQQEELIENKEAVKIENNSDANEIEIIDDKPKSLKEKVITIQDISTTRGELNNAKQTLQWQRKSDKEIIEWSSGETNKRGQEHRKSGYDKIGRTYDDQYKKLIKNNNNNPKYYDDDEIIDITDLTEQKDIKKSHKKTKKSKKSKKDKKKKKKRAKDKTESSDDSSAWESV